MVAKEAKKVLELVEKGSKLMFDINISPKSWVLPNRVKFTNWIDETFKYDALSVSNAAIKTRKGKKEDTQKNACGSKSDSIELFSHQKFIKDYVQFDSPYRGVLVYHGLGVGKTCSAVAAAEILLKNMNVTVMLPASLKPNFIDEIKKCGSIFYKVKQNWTFISREEMEGIEGDIFKLMPIEGSVIKKNGGLWVPSGDKKANFSSLSEAAQNQIKDQIDSLIKNRFNFISYNGLRRSHVEEWTEGGRNPFDNQCIIVDEVHNLISKIVNARAIGQAIYKLLMTAKNCKMILLSGTPIINYPFEIAYVVNLLMGPRSTIEIKANKASEFDTDRITKSLTESEYVDYFSYDENAKTISMVMVPEGFKIVNKPKSLISKDPKQLTKSDMYSHVAADLRKKADLDIARKTSKDEKALPEDQEEFNKYFINFATNLVNNPKLFMKRILGSVSFYSTYSPELYPTVTRNEIVQVQMNDFQFPIYEEARAKEMKKESLSKNKSNDDNPFASSGQVYRFYSRAICNFVFPEEIKRPYPSKSSFTKSELDVVEEDEAELFGTEGESSKKLSKSAERDEYLAELNKALSDLSKDMHSKDSYLNEKNIGKYSPKFKAIYDKIKPLNGNALVYSQFRKVEGLGVLGLVLQANGYAEFKVKKLSNGDWDIDIAKEDWKKPKYTMFTGNNEESKLLLKIFNSDFETLPEGIKSKLPNLMTKRESLNNLHGGLIKVIMITQSGAEGISLKNVRQVHIVEPYWNQVRMDQVIGRAVRTCSHVELPADERNVEVYTYTTVFAPELIAKSFTLKTKDKGMTTDEYIYNIAFRKNRIIQSILDLLKKAAVDCGVNAKKHKNVKCFAFPTNLPDNALSYNNNIRDDMLDYQYDSDLIDLQWKGQVYKTKIGNFLVNTQDNSVYDYDLYVDSGKLVKIGVLKKENGKVSIVKERN